MGQFRRSTPRPPEFHTQNKRRSRCFHRLLFLLSEENKPAQGLTGQRKSLPLRRTDPQRMEFPAQSACPSLPSIVFNAFSISSKRLCRRSIYRSSIFLRASRSSRSESTHRSPAWSQLSHSSFQHFLQAVGSSSCPFQSIPLPPFLSPLRL